MSRFVRFALVGATGFLVDAAVLWVLIRGAGLGPFVARVFAIAVAMATTWALNRAFTFGRSDRSLVSEGARYGGVGLLAALLNYAVYSAALWLAPGLPPHAALALGSAVAMCFSFMGYSRFVFGRAEKA